MRQASRDNQAQPRPDQAQAQVAQDFVVDVPSMSFLYTLVLAGLTLWHLRLRIRIKHAVVCLSSCYALRPPTSHIVAALSLYLSLIPTRFSLAKTTRTTTMSNINEPKFIRQMDVLAEGTRQGGGIKRQPE